MANLEKIAAFGSFGDDLRNAESYLEQVGPLGGASEESFSWFRNRRRKEE